MISIKRFLTLALLCGPVFAQAQVAGERQEKKAVFMEILRKAKSDVKETPEQIAARDELFMKMKPKYDLIDSIRRAFNNETDVVKKEAVFNNFYSSRASKDDFFKLYIGAMLKDLAVGYATVNNEARADAYLEKITNPYAKEDAIQATAMAYARGGNPKRGLNMLKSKLDGLFLPDGKLKPEGIPMYDNTVRAYIEVLPPGSEKEILRYLKVYYDFNEGAFPTDVSRAGNTQITPKQQLFYKYAKAIPVTEAKEIASILVKAFEIGAVPDSLKAEVIQDFKQVPNLKQHMENQIALNKDNFGKQVAQLLSKPDINGKVWGAAALKGKYILIDFWGSWCIPCRASHPHLTEIYHIYKSKGLEIVGVANEGSGTLERQREIWKKAVAEDQMDWIQLLNNENQQKFDAVKVFGIGSYPTKILIDPEGREIARFSVGAADLDSKLKEIFGF